MMVFCCLMLDGGEHGRKKDGTPVLMRAIASNLSGNIHVVLEASSAEAIFSLILTLTN